MPESAPSIERLFVANRGEIALRVIRAAQALGMETVLGVSVADRDGLAARASNRTVVIGPAQARDSYLNVNLVVHAAKATGCTALHPGYGFLAERAELAELCEEEGITFVGPTAASIRKLGDKISARALAERASVPTVSGSGEVGDVADALRIAEQIGYPVITKASAGGGGRGMAVAREPGELAAAFDPAMATAREAFGDGTLFIERYFEAARHIEVQAIGDGKGGVVHFGERDCSIQRRYQKMIEEAPAAILPPHVRERIQIAATELLASIDYRNAGTVEFLYDPASEEFFFMEVNARIQVEHPVSEAITGADLVEAQLLLSSGALEGFRQEDIHIAGHAIEARIIAEDPDLDFLPCPGRITFWAPPAGPGVRVDSAMETGAMVPPYYDSLIAKLIVHGADRGEAISRLAHALGEFKVEGIATNIPLLKYIAAHPDFRANRINTRWLELELLPAFRSRYRT